MPSPKPSHQEALRQQAIQLFPGSFYGSECAAWLVISRCPLNDLAKHALAASARALGVDPENLGYLVLTHQDDDGSSDAPRLLSLIEALDPLAVILADHDSTALASRAYHKPLALEAPEHLLGRPCACFENLEVLMSAPEDKQRVWHCLKALEG